MAGRPSPGRISAPALGFGVGGSVCPLISGLRLSIQRQRGTDASEWTCERDTPTHMGLETQLCVYQLGDYDQRPEPSGP